MVSIYPRKIKNMEEYELWEILVSLVSNEISLQQAHDKIWDSLGGEICSCHDGMTTEDAMTGKSVCYYCGLKRN